MCYFVLPDDHSRVVLNHQDHVTGSDYINASFIDVSNSVSQWYVINIYQCSGLCQGKGIHCSTGSIEQHHR